MTFIIAQHYQVLEVLGAGGMGDVYRGLDTRTEQIVAIKQLKPEITTPEMIERFVREGVALRELNHPNIVKMLDAVEQDGTHYLVMEFVSGGDLLHLLDEHKPLSINRILNIAIDLADALTRAHRLNIIHRDLKPANILIVEDGTIRLTDFGVAHFDRKDKAPITDAEVIVGTLDYLSPEALSGQRVDVRSDIWSFGVLLYEMIAGQRPFVGEQLGQIILQIVSQPAPHLEDLREDTPLALVDLVYRMLEKDPQSRIPSVRVVGMELEAILQGHDIDTAHIPSSFVIVESPRFNHTPLIPTVQKHNLPAQATSFIGRENELRELEALINTSRLVTILASGGMGKTRLAIEMGNTYLSLLQQSTASPILKFVDGIYFIDLAPLTDPASIVQTLANALGYPLQSDGRDPKQQILDYVREKALLLIMDNFEHLMSASQIVSDILAAAPKTKILVTSRQRLNQTGETIFELQGFYIHNLKTLDNPLENSAVKLFMQSARRIKPNYDLSADDVQFIVQICQLVYGVPLGIILAASWIDMLSPQEIAAEIDSSLNFLETEMTDIPERQRSIKAVFDYSWNLMQESEQQTFMKLAVFRGGMTLQAAQNVTGADLRTLRSLVAKSLLNRDASSGRYETHELLRQFAEERLKDSGAFEPVNQAHAEYFAAWMETMAIDIKGKRQIAGLQNIEADFENVQRAWLWTTQGKNLAVLNQLIDSVYWYCILYNIVVKGAELFALARRVFPAQEPSSMVGGRLEVRFVPEQIDPLPVYKHGLEIAQREANQAEIAFCLQQLGRHYVHILRDFDLGYPMQAESLKIYQGLGASFEAAHLLDEMAFSYAIKGDETARIQYARQSLALRQEIGDKVGAADVLLNIGAAEYSLSHFDLSEEYIEQALVLYKETASLYGIGMSQAFLAMILLRKDDDARTRTLAEQSLRIAKDVHHAHTNFLALFVFGNLECLDGYYLKAIQFFKEIQNITNDPVSLMQTYLAHLASLIGLERFADASTLWQEISKDETVIPLSTYGYVYRSLTIMLYIPQMTDVRAVENLSTIHECSDLFYIPVHKLPFCRAWQGRLAEKLGTDAYLAAWERGKSLQLEEVFTMVKQEFLDKAS